MKVALSTRGKTLDDAVEPRFGRSPRFLVFDTDKQEVMGVYENGEAANMAHGAGIQTATRVSRLGVDAGITGIVGPKAFSVLSAAGIKVFSCQEGTMREAIDRLASGALEPDSAPGGGVHGL